MSIAGSRVAIVGGSIAGCAAAIALGKAGCEVAVFERSSGELEDRGAGIAIPVSLRDQLQSAGYLPASYPACALAKRFWILDDGTPQGRLLWKQPGQAVTNNWGVLWRSLRANVRDTDYHDGVAMRSYRADRGGVTVELGEGSGRRFDALVGADGYRSAIRQSMPWGSEADYSGYILWRGNYEEGRVTDRAWIDRTDAEQAWTTVCFDGGHGVIYMIPNFDDRTDPGHRRVNWAVYTPQPEGLDFTEPTSLPPGEVGPELYAHLDRLLTESFPERIEALIRLSLRDEVSIQPVYDELPVHYTAERTLLIGDAGAVTRPHTGSGATKALQDALALEKLARECTDWESLLEAYDAQRIASANTIVDLGRRIGRAQVEETPNWGAMTPEDFDAWTKATLAGESLYLYGNVQDADGP
ncbi:MAG TPA: FAD-dependent monooxygenase [Longimicrobiales bacterium]|nr:FAD-dependent monooxygenase [Longimicrobiales bacterium]